MSSGENVGSHFDTDGNLVFTDVAGAELLKLDGVNRKVVIASGSELEVAGNVDFQAQLFEVYLADGQDETMDITIPVTGLVTADRITAVLVLATKAAIATVVKRAITDFSISATDEVTVGANAANNTNNQYVFFVLKA